MLLSYNLKNEKQHYMLFTGKKYIAESWKSLKIIKKIKAAVICEV